MKLERDKLLNIVADGIIAKLDVGKNLLVGIDGYDGAGKTTFADELAIILSKKDCTIIRSSVDYFLNSKETRYRKGKRSPVGFYEDSFNYAKLKSLLLDTIVNRGDTYVTQYFNVKKNQIQQTAPEILHETSVLIFDGIFLHRSQLINFWNYSIFLEVSRTETLRRCFLRDKSGSPFINAEVNRRYVEGQNIYFQKVKPFEKATIVINNENFEKPFIMKEKK